LQIPSFSTKTLDYFFYFPENGKFKIYPANVSRNGIVVGVSKD